MNPLGTVAIIGVGLVGGSIGLALRSQRLAQRVFGLGRNPDRLETATRLGAIDWGTTDPERALSAAEVVVVCTPVTQIPDDVRRAVEYAPAEVLVTDAGSTKRRLVEAIEAHEPSRRAFVGAHPLAGSELQGVEHARVDLFQGRVCVLTPTPRTPFDRRERAIAFWKSLGCRTWELSVEAHDAALALTSHLPHLVAAALANAVPDDVLPFAAGAYRDGTRVAGSSESLWTGIFLENREALLEALDTFEGQLQDFRQALEQSDEHRLRACWNLAKMRREQFRQGNARPPSADQHSS